ncbi:MAG: hypothetical protein KAG97_05340, partial [Victivallales bacterium]|nr:hypothetical protein [Victivallales bacterium]
RMFDERLSGDDTATFSSYVKYGPFNIGGGDYYNGLISEMIGALAEGSGDVQWDVHAAETCEGVVDSTSRANGVFVEGLNYKVHPRVSGGAGMVVLSGSDGTPWAVERLTMVVDQAGEQRKL